MNPKRKTDLHRMLALAPVPKPPAGLAERIKSDIPQHLRASQARERERVSQSIVFNLRIAASIVLLISSVYICIHLLSRMETAEVKEQATIERTERLLGTKPPVPQGSRQASPQAASEAPAPAAPKPVAQFSPEPSAQAKAQSGPSAGSRPTPPPPTPAVDSYSISGNAPVVIAGADDENSRKTESQFAPGRTAAKTAEEPLSIADRSDRDKQVRENKIAAAAPQPAKASKDSTSPGEPTAAGGGVAQGLAAESPQPTLAFDAQQESRLTESVGAVMEKRAAAAPSAARKRASLEPTSFFGFETDARSVDLVKAVLRRGERPAAGSVHTGSIVSQFASAMASEAAEVRVEVEAAPAPFGKSALLRVSIDTPGQKAPAESPQPIATDASLTLEFDNKAITARRLTGTDAAAAPHVVRMERSILRSASVTALYTIELLPDGGSVDFRLARASLSYRSSKEGKMLTIEKTLRRSDLAPSWNAASERLQIASLAKAWSESLRGGGEASPTEVATQARALANRFPLNPKARELADLAETSARLP